MEFSRRSFCKSAIACSVMFPVLGTLDDPVIAEEYVPIQIDTSGSISKEQMNMFLMEVTKILGEQK